jgi:sulfate adenylyltransferase
MSRKKPHDSRGLSVARAISRFWETANSPNSKHSETQSMRNTAAVPTSVAVQSNHLIAPHGGSLVNLLASPDRCAELQAESRDWLSWDLTQRQICDLELLMNGAFSPLRGFMCRADYESVCSSMRLTNGLIWPMPVTLDLPEKLATKLAPDAQLALRDSEGVMVAVLHVEEIWQPDRDAEVNAVYGTASRMHPGVTQVLERSNPWYVGGRVEGIRLPSHYDFRNLRLCPAQLRDEFSRLGWKKIVAFQTQDLMHRAHLELTWRAAKGADANLLIHPSVGATKPDDVEHYTRVRCYQALLAHFPAGSAKLSLLPLATRMAGPREAVWHAIIRKNYGCTHLIVGPNHAGPEKAAVGRPFYEPCDAQKLLCKHAFELGVQMVPVQTMVYVPEHGEYFPEHEVPAGATVANISGAELQNILNMGDDIPEWFTFPEVARQLRRTYRPRPEQGLAIFMTGLSGSGKSTIANALFIKLLEIGGRPVTVLDGDLVRKHLSSELGFSKEHRDINIRRIGFVAAEIAKNGGIALCAPIAPYDRVRKDVRAMVENGSGFILVHIATPIEVCEQRDRKGLYAKARAGVIPSFTGISDPYETPTDAEITIDTTRVSVEEAADQILAYLHSEGYFGGLRANSDEGVWSSAIRANGNGHTRMGSHAELNQTT